MAPARTPSPATATLQLLLGCAEQRTGRTPSALTLGNLELPPVLAFLDHLEIERGNTERTRNLRLTAIRSFVRYAPDTYKETFPQVPSIGDRA